jgi:DNA-directed RNA polymerase sigma subunit (sigma70/sigma32)
MVELTFEEYSKRRNSKIVHMIDNDLMTMTAVAKYFGISKQRVQQIYSREKGKGV